MTPKQLRSAAHALRTAANALEDVTTQLRTLSTEIDTPADPVLPTAPYVWHDGEIWTRDEDGDYISATDRWADRHLQSSVPHLREAAHTFAREAVPVTLVPTREWEEWRRSTAHRECQRTEADLMNATDVMTGW